MIMGIRFIEEETGPRNTASFYGAVFTCAALECCRIYCPRAEPQHQNRQPERQNKKNESPSMVRNQEAAKPAQEVSKPVLTKKQRRAQKSGSLNNSAS